MCAELSPHIVGEAFYNAEVENELRRIGKISYRMYKDSDRELCMDMIEEERRERIYLHTTCSLECKKRGELAECNECYLHCFNLFRVWCTVGDRRYMENCVSSLYVQSGGMFVPSMDHTDCDIPCSIQWVDSQHSISPMFVPTHQSVVKPSAMTTAHR